MDQKIFDIILKNENSLLIAPSRHSYDHLNELLADDFIEFGSSGNIYHKQDILARLPKENSSLFSMEDISIKQIGNQVFLMAYKAKKHSSIPVISSFHYVAHYGKNLMLIGN